MQPNEEQSTKRQTQAPPAQTAQQKAEAENHRLLAVAARTEARRDFINLMEFMDDPEAKRNYVALEVAQRKFDLLQRRATMYAESGILPDAFHGNVGACCVALNIADRVGLDEMAVFQHLYLVHNRPAWSATMMIAAYNASRKFGPLNYEVTGTGDDLGCVAFSKDKDGNRVEGPRVTIKIAKDEGWYQRKGSKWVSIPLLMLRYRAATFLVRTVAPEVLMGFPVVEELEDIGPGVPEFIAAEPAVIAEINAELKKKSPDKKPTAKQESQDQPPGDGAEGKPSASAQPKAAPAPAAETKPADPTGSVKAATRSQIAKFEPLLTTVVWREVLQKFDIEDIAVEQFPEELGRKVVQAMTETQIAREEAAKAK